LIETQRSDRDPQAAEIAPALQQPARVGSRTLLDPVGFTVAFGHSSSLELALLLDHSDSLKLVSLLGWRARALRRRAIALLFTDIEGSTRLATELGAGWAGVLADHHELVGGAIAEAGGFVAGTEGDAFFATFEDAVAAGRAAVTAQRALRAHSWPRAVGELKVRMGLHVGQVQRTQIGYVGLEVHRAARVAAAAHGGELLVTAEARELAGEELITESVGVHRLKDFPAPVVLFCAVIDGRGAAAFPPPRTESVRPTNLPAGRPQLIGRADQLAEVVDAVVTDGERLVTITGLGGAGKTSLALLAGAELLDGHPGGVWWVDLTGVGSPDEVRLAIAAVVGAEDDPEGSVEAALTTRLRNSGATLVIVDNMEHVLAAAGTLQGLLDRLPDLRLLVTSRVPLRVDPERVIALDALDERSALELVARSARRRGRQPPLSGAGGDALREIVRLLDGLPLALELAAARLSVLSAVQLRDRLRESIGVLGEVRGGRPARHRSLRAALDSTLAVLDPAPRALFVRMGAFAAPVELHELERVLSDDGVSVLDALAELVDAALVQRVETGDGAVRFGLAEALRQIASELLDRSPDGRHWRHAHAERQYELMWAFRTVWVDRQTYLAAARSAEREAAAALRWATDNNDVLEQSIAAVYALLLVDSGRVREGGAITERLIASAPADAEVRFVALSAHAHYLLEIGRLDAARRSADEAYRAASDTKTRSSALIRRGLSNVFGGHTAQAVKDHADATALARKLPDDPAFLAGALALEGQALIGARLLDEAAARLAEARTVGSPVDAEALYSLDTLLGDLAIFNGRPTDAIEPFTRSLEQSLANGNFRQIMYDLFGVAEALAALGHDAESLEVAGMAESQGVEIGAAPDIPYVEHLRDLQQRIGPARAAELKQRGLADDPVERVARACQLARAHASAPTAAPGRGIQALQNRTSPLG
jgi:predicted ATPase/class 3 adenylate cyclase